MTAERVWEKVELPGGYRLVRDEKHGFLEIMPRPSEEELESFYGKVYQNPCCPHDPVGQVNTICDLVPLAGRVLDIGCGNGEILGVF